MWMWLYLLSLHINLLTKTFTSPSHIQHKINYSWILCISVQSQAFHTHTLTIEISRYKIRKWDSLFIHGHTNFPPALISWDCQFPARVKGLQLLLCFSDKNLKFQLPTEWWLFTTDWTTSNTVKLEQNTAEDQTLQEVQNLNVVWCGFIFWLIMRAA